MPSFSEILRRNMRAERARKHWGQDKLGRALGGWSRSRVSALETGNTQLHVEDILPICKALGVTFVDLIQGCDPDDLSALGLGLVRVPASRRPAHDRQPRIPRSRESRG